MVGYWWRLQRQRVSRRRLLRAAGIGVVGLTAAAMMRPHLGASSVARAEGEKERGGRYRMAVAFFSDTLDPHVSFAFGALLAPRIYNALAVRAPGDPSFFYLDLADAIEQPDETTCVFSIRPGVRVAPNSLGVTKRDLDAHDAFATFDRILNEPAAIANRFVSQWFDSHSAPDAQTYVVNMAAPYAYFLDRLGTVFTTIPPRELVENPSLMATNGAGGGPFVPQGPASGSGVALDRNPNYYRTDSANGNAQLPYVDGYDVTVISDRAARRAAFVSQQIYEYTAADLDEANDLAGQVPANVVGQPVNTFISFGMNVKRPPWNDARIRRAAMHATNRQQYIDLIYGGAARANGLVHWPMGDFAFSDEKLEKLQPYDPALARSLIQQATGEDTVRIDVMYPATDIQQHDMHLPIFVQQMEQAGFEVAQRPMDFATWLGNYINVEYDANLAVNQIYDTAELPLDFHHSLGPQGDETYGTGLQNSDIDALIDAARGASNYAAHVQAVHDAQRAIYEAGPAFLPIVSPLSQTLYWNFVKNVPQGVGPAGLFLNDWWLSEIDSDVPGDVNCSGVSNAIDAALILQQDAALIASVPCPENADVNSDELVNSIDAAIILQRDAGIAGLPRQ